MHCIYCVYLCSAWSSKCLMQLRVPTPCYDTSSVCACMHLCTNARGCYTQAG